MFRLTSSILPQHSNIFTSHQPRSSTLDPANKSLCSSTQQQQCVNDVTLLVMLKQMLYIAILAMSTNFKEQTNDPNAAIL